MRISKSNLIVFKFVKYAQKLQLQCILDKGVNLSINKYMTAHQATRITFNDAMTMIAHQRPLSLYSNQPL